VRLTIFARVEIDHTPYSYIDYAQESTIFFLRPTLVKHLDCDVTLSSDPSAVRLVLAEYRMVGQHVFNTQEEGFIPRRMPCHIHHTSSAGLLAVHGSNCKRTGGPWCEFYQLWRTQILGRILHKYDLPNNPRAEITD
jgi:hypothetical protein